MKFTNMNKDKLYIRPHWLVDGHRIPIHLLMYSYRRKEWVYIDPEQFIKNKKLVIVSRVGNKVRSETDIVQFTENMEIKDIWKRKTPSLDLDMCKNSFIRDKMTEKLYRWSRSGKKWREVDTFVDMNNENRYEYVNDEDSNDMYNCCNIDMLVESYPTSNYKIYKNKTKEKKMKTDKNYTGKAQIVVVHYINEIGEIPRKEIDGYAFKADLSLKLKDGDIVVVDDANGLSVCVVTKVLSDGTDIAYHAKMARLANAWIVNKVNDKPHLKRIKATEELKKIDIELEELKKAAIKKKELEAELKLLSEITGSKELLKRREKLLNG